MQKIPSSNSINLKLAPYSLGLVANWKSEAYDVLKDKEWQALQIDEIPRFMGLRTERHVKALAIDPSDSSKLAMYESIHRDMVCQEYIVAIKGVVHHLHYCVLEDEKKKT